MNRCYKCNHYKEIKGVPSEGKVYKCTKWKYERNLNWLSRLIGCDEFSQYFDFVDDNKVYEDYPFKNIK